MISVVYDIFIITEMKENLKLNLSLKRTISAAFEIKPQCVVGTCRPRPNLADRYMWNSSG